MWQEFPGGLRFRAQGVGRALGVYRLLHGPGGVGQETPGDTEHQEAPGRLMGAITLHQPWASLIAHGVKDIETRSWPPSHSLVGQRVAIHAGKRIVGPRSLNLETQEAIERLYGPKWSKAIPAGAVVATAVLVNAAQVLGLQGPLVMLAGSPPMGPVAHDPYGDFTPGRWLWFLGDVEAFDPVPAVGRQGLWMWNGTPACCCPDFERTMHLGSRYCPGFGGQAAHCLTCGGCKACRLYAEYRSYRPKGELEQHPSRMDHHSPKD